MYCKPRLTLLERLRPHASGVLLFRKRHNFCCRSYVDRANRSNSDGRHYRMAYTVVLISDMCLIENVFGSNKIRAYREVFIYMRYVPDNM